MFSVVPQQVADKHGGHVEPRDRRGPAGTNGTHRGRTPFAVDQNPVAERIDNVGANEREGYGFHHVHRLQAATHGEIEQQGQEACGQRLGVGNGKG